MDDKHKNALVQKSDEEWKSDLGTEAYQVLRENGTERPFSSQFNKPGHVGSFHCKGCDSALFESEAQFDSGCGWPSFDRPHPNSNIEERMDLTYGMVRIEVRCKTCDGHLGHVFPDGPTATRKRFCINGVCLVAKTR